MQIRKEAFTLVELIVVITIVAILGTIAFISLQGYSQSSRDSVRLSDMSNIKISFELFHIDAGKYPIPTNGAEITYSGAEVWTQGIFGIDTFNNISKLDRIPLDPLTGNKYTYSLLNTKQEYQISGILEGDNYASLTNNTYAVSTKKATAIVSGNYNGLIAKVFTGSTTYVLAVPSLITSSDLVIDFDLIDIITSNKLVADGYKNLPSNYSNSLYAVNGETNLNLVNSSDVTLFVGTLENLSLENNQIILVENIQLAYTGTELSDTTKLLEVLNVDIINNPQSTLFISQVLINSTINPSIEITAVPTILGSSGTNGIPATCLDMTDKHIIALNTFLSKTSVELRDSSWNLLSGDLTKEQWCTGYELDILNDISLTSIPTEITYLKDLFYLWIDGVGITDLPSGISNLTNLDTIQLNNNIALTELQTEILYLTNLKTLDISFNSLTTLPSNIGNLNNLEYLYMQNNSITSLPSEIVNLDSLKQIRLSGNIGLGNLSFDFNQSSNVLCEINIIIGNLCIGGNGSNIYLADDNALLLVDNYLTDTDVTNLNTAFGLTYTKIEWYNLTSLNLNYKSLTVLPIEIGKLTNLTSLSLSGNQLTILPTEIGNLINLTSLLLNNNLLNSFPTDLLSLINLNILDLTSNQISTLPSSIGFFTNLITLKIGNNGLASLPIEIGNLTNLEGLYASYNDLVSLPSNIGNLINLKYLDLGSNYVLTSLPSSIGNLINLLVLDLASNSLTILPIEISTLVNVYDLSISSNAISVLQPEIGNLVSLRTFSCNSCGLTTLPQEMTNLTKLTLINIRSNTLLGAFDDTNIYPSTAEICEVDIPITGQTMCITGNGTTIDITVTP